MGLLMLLSKMSFENLFHFGYHIMMFEKDTNICLWTLAQKEKYLAELALHNLLSLLSNLIKSLLRI